MKLLESTPQAPCASRMPTAPANLSMARKAQRRFRGLRALVPPAARSRRSGRNGRARHRSRMPSSPEKTRRRPCCFRVARHRISSAISLPEPHPVRPPSRRSTARIAILARQLEERFGALAAPRISSSRDTGVWPTPLSTSTPTTSNCASGARTFENATSASQTALSFGPRLLPTARMILFICIRTDAPILTVFRT